jgi:diaminohydroxyphosphoribosylaminopyrimidine deaminase / 5-amino-6-(5-phosphoribosylamino)uracil reductase
MTSLKMPLSHFIQGISRNFAMMEDSFYMKRCIHLAKLGQGNAAPNPLVGAVIVFNNKIIGEGYHEKYGEAHAEVNAVNSVKDKTLLAESTIYVCLEPCAHFGKTPPCSDLIIEYKIKNVVIGCIDSYSEVAGKGVAKLKAAGINVKTGVLEKECLELNKRFFTYHNKKRPYVILKWAESIDGFMDIEREQNQEGVHWISQAETKQMVHKWRNEENGIAVGANTFLTDHPKLTVREIEGNSPTRFIIGNIGGQKNNFEFNIGSDVRLTVHELMDEIYEQNIQSILIEGGASILNQFLKAKIWDEVRIIRGVNKISKGLKSPKLDIKPTEEYSYGKDFIQIYLND